MDIKIFYSFAVRFCLGGGSDSYRKVNVLLGYVLANRSKKQKADENALVAELVDALDSKSSSFGSVGSIPTQGTE